MILYLNNVGYSQYRFINAYGDIGRLNIVLGIRYNSHISVHYSIAYRSEEVEIR